MIENPYFAFVHEEINFWQLISGLVILLLVALLLISTVIVPSMTFETWWRLPAMSQLQAVPNYDRKIETTYPPLKAELLNEIKFENKK